MGDIWKIKLVKFGSLLGSSRNAPLGRALRDEPKNGCVGDYLFGCQSHNSETHL